VDASPRWDRKFVVLPSNEGFKIALLDSYCRRHVGFKQLLCFQVEEGSLGQWTVMRLYLSKVLYCR
jgi:hypothetical protein